MLRLLSKRQLPLPGGRRLASLSASRGAAATVPLRSYAVPRLGLPSLGMPSKSLVPATMFRRLSDAAAAQQETSTVSKEPVLIREAKDALARGDYGKAAGLHPSAGAFGKSGLLDKYGLIQVVGMGAIAAISKEMFILNEEFVLVGTFSSFLFLVYLGLRENFMTAVKESREEQTKALTESYDSALYGLQLYEASLARGVPAPQVVKEQEEYVNNLTGAYLDAFHRRQKLAINAEYQAKLQQLVQSEKNARDARASEALSFANQYVRRKFAKASADFKTAFINSQLVLLEGGSASTKGDPIQQLYEEAFAKYKELSKPTVRELTSAEMQEAKAEVDSYNTNIDKQIQNHVERVRSGAIIELSPFEAASSTEEQNKELQQYRQRMEAKKRVVQQRVTEPAYRQKYKTLDDYIATL